MVRAAVMKGPNQPIEVDQFAPIQLQQGGAIVRTLYSEVCGTDVHLWHGRLAEVPYPIIPGHISAGEIMQTGGEVTDINGTPLLRGDVVTFHDVHQTCHSCWYCTVAEAHNRCPQRKVYGITYPATEGLLGGWSEQIYLLPGVKIVKLPPTLPARTFIAGGCGLSTALSAVQRGGIRPGDTVTVLGSGPVGLSTVVFAKLQGAAQVLLIGAPSDRLQLGARMGADHTVNIQKQSFEQRSKYVLQLTGGRGSDVTIEATGVPEAVRQAMILSRDGGTAVIAGQYTDAGEVAFNPHLHLNKKHLNLLGCWGTTFSHFYRSLQLMNRYHHRFPWKDMISKCYGLAEAEQALRDVESRSVIKAVITPQAG